LFLYAIGNTHIFFRASNQYSCMRRPVNISDMCG
jgi:hypothetical protein